MPLGNISLEPKSRRPPGQLPNVMRPFEEALQRLPESLKKTLAPTFEALVDGARVQNRLNAMLWAMHEGLPARHAVTHLGGSDNLVSSQIPTAIEFDNVGAPGDPHEGVSAQGHIHPVGTDIASLLPLTETTTEVLNGYDVLYVFDPMAEGLLEEILLELRIMTGDIG